MKREIDKSTALQRVSSPALDEILGWQFPALDHGFIRCIDYLGDEAAITQAARVSYGTGTTTVNSDINLIRYLLRHRHTTPFEMCEIKLHMKLPIFVARQWIRHRTASVNEYSARYSIMEKEFYIPEADVLAPQSKQNNQGRSSEVISQEEADNIQWLLKRDAEQCYETYQYLMNEPDGKGVRPHDHTGIARELARMNLTLNTYTQWYWKIDLHNLIHFLKLRVDPHAQYEIRVYAEVILDILRKWVPNVVVAAEEYVINSFTMSESMLRANRLLMEGHSVESVKQLITMSKREWADFLSAVGRE